MKVSYVITAYVAPGATHQFPFGPQPVPAGDGLEVQLVGRGPMMDPAVELKSIGGVTGFDGGFPTHDLILNGRLPMSLLFEEPAMPYLEVENTSARPAYVDLTIVGELDVPLPTAPLLLSATVQNADPTVLQLVFDQDVLFSDASGWSIAGHTIVGAPVGAGSSWVLQLGEPFVSGENRDVDYVSTSVVGVYGGLSMADGSTAVTNLVALWEDVFDRPDGPLVTWVSKGHSFAIQANKLQSLAADASYSWVYNPAGGALPNDIYMEVELDDGVTSTLWYGFAARYDPVGPPVNCGVRLFKDGSAHPGPLTLGCAQGPSTLNRVITVTGGYPAGWLDPGTHKMGLELIGNAARIILDEQTYGTADVSGITQISNHICLLGEGQLRGWPRFSVYAPGAAPAP